MLFNSSSSLSLYSPPPSPSPPPAPLPPSPPSPPQVKNVLINSAVGKVLAERREIKNKVVFLLLIILVFFLLRLPQAPVVLCELLFNGQLSK